MELIDLFLKEQYVVTFFLLFARFSALFAFFPFFEHSSIPISIKTASVLYITILFFPITPLYFLEVSTTYLLMALISEILTGFFASILLKITFDMLSFAGENISFAIGLSTAVAFDPASGTQSTAIGNFLKLSAIITLLSFDGHHMILLYMSEYIKNVPLGSLVMNENIVAHFMHIVKNFFIIGFSMAFPIVVLSLFMDIIFGMIMKTIPQFQVIVVGVPIKIALGFIVLFAVFGSIMFVWKREFMEAFNSLQIFLIH